MHYTGKTTEIRIDTGGQITFVGCPNGENLVRQSLPFARLAYFEPEPAFVNEWIRPPVRKPATYSKAIAATGNQHLLEITFDDGSRAEFNVACLPEGVRFTVRSFKSSTQQLPAALRFAQVAPHIDKEDICIGMSLNLKTDGADLPGISELLYAEGLFHFDIVGCSYIIAATSRKEQRKVMQDITVNHTQDIPWLPCAGAFAAEAKDMQGSYLMTFGAYLEGSLTPKNLDGWIAMLKEIGITQVSFHGAEGKNFTFGDCQPHRPIFPEGRKSMREVLERLHANGIKAIEHTYSSLIDPNCSLVNPKPHPLLGYNRHFTLTEDIDAESKEIPIAEDTAEISLVHTSHFNSTRYVIWDDELIEFKALGENRLEQCVRGALGTTPAPHRKGTAGRNLKSSYGLFAPDIDGPLFKLVAQNTADFFNECDFDGLYFDALEGVSTLEGRNLYGYYSSKFVYEVARRLNKPAGMEMSSMFHNLWYMRSRMGAWDRPFRAQKKFIERHAEVNRASQKKSLLPQNLGWWYLGANGHPSPVQSDRITTDVYENMGRLALANNFSLSFQGLTLPVFESCEEVRRFAGQIRRYEEIRLQDKLSEEEKERIADRECHLLDKGFYPSYYLQAIAQFQDGKAEIIIDNPCHAQIPFTLRFEPLHNPAKEARQEEQSSEQAPDTDRLVLAQSSLENAESENPLTEQPLLDLEKFEDLRVITSRTVQANISLQQTAHGKAVCLNATAAKEIGCARFEQRFATPLNIKGQDGFGVWIHGDGKGEVLNFQLRSVLLQASGLCEKMVKVDFTGWKYFSLIENSAAQVMEYLWPYYHRQLDREREFAPLEFENSGNDWPDSFYFTDHRSEGNPHHITASLPDFTRIAVSAVWINNLPKGEQCSVMIAGWHTFFTETNPVHKLKMGNIQIEGTLPENSIAEFSDGSWFTGDVRSRPVPVAITGKPEMLQGGKNNLQLQAEVADGTRLRVTAAVMEKKPLVQI